MKLGIGAKLNILLVPLLGMSMVGVALLTGGLFLEDLTSLLRKETLDSASMLAGRLRADVRWISERAQAVTALALEGRSDLKERLAGDPTQLGLAIYRRATPDSPLAPLIQVAHPEAATYLAPIADPALLEAAERGTIEVRTMSAGERPIIRFAFPVVESAPGKFSHVAVADFAPERFVAILSESSGSMSALVDRSGRVVASTAAERFAPGADLGETDLFKRARSGDAPNGQSDFTVPGGASAPMIGAFHKLGFADLTVLAFVPSESIASAREEHYRRTFLATGIFVFVAIAVGFVFSRGLVAPIRELAGAAERVARGDFTTRLSARGPGRFVEVRDEISEFAATFDRMVKGLQALNKFQGKEIADQILGSKKLELGGERKHAVVLFSDIRDFTPLSERMDPQALVALLNRYFTRMIGVIKRNGGIVSKFQGDALLALWGLPDARLGDADRAIRAGLEMRVELDRLNQEIIREGHEPLRIGVGIHAGQVVAGNIGSEDRMEYTVMGDPVNTASRVQSATKEFGADLLISHELLRKSSGKYLIERIDSRLKGKKEVVTLYKVNGYVEAKTGAPVVIKTPYSSSTPPPKAAGEERYAWVEADPQDEDTATIERSHLVKSG